MHVCGNKFPSKLLLVAANICNFRFFFCKCICVHRFDRSTDTILLRNYQIFLWLKIEFQRTADGYFLLFNPIQYGIFYALTTLRGGGGEGGVFATNSSISKTTHELATKMCTHIVTFSLVY